MDEKECKVRKDWERKRVQNVKIEKERPNQFWNLKNSKFNPLPGNLMNLHHYSTLKNFWVIIFQITIAITLTYIALRWVGNQLTPSMRKPKLSLEWKNEMEIVKVYQYKMYLSKKLYCKLISSGMKLNTILHHHKSFMKVNWHTVSEIPGNGNEKLSKVRQ